MKSHGPLGKLHLGKVVFLLLNSVLDLQEQCRLPLVELAHLVELEEFVCEHITITLLDSFGQIAKELVFPRGGEEVVHVAVAFQSALGANEILAESDQN
jgi:hypothetical protein